MSSLLALRAYHARNFAGRRESGDQAGLGFSSAHAACHRSGERDGPIPRELPKLPKKAAHVTSTSFTEASRTAASRFEGQRARSQHGARAPAVRGAGDRRSVKRGNNADPEIATEGAPGPAAPTAPLVPLPPARFFHMRFIEI